MSACMQAAALFATIAFWGLAVPFVLYVGRHHALSTCDAIMVAVGIKKVHLTTVQDVFRILLVVVPLGVFLIAKTNYCLI